MKKIFVIAAAALGLLVTACQKELVKGTSDSDAKVSFTVEIPDVIQTKAMAQAEEVDIVYYEIWNSDWTKRLYPAQGELASAEVSQRMASIDVSVIIDQTYNFIFWAQDKDHKAYDVTDLQNVKIKYDVIAADGNQDRYDAYYAVESIEVNGSTSKTVILKRPFAQLNFGASMMNSVFGDIEVSASEVTVTNLATSFNTREGEGENESAAEVTFKAEGIATNEPLATNNTTYAWITMDYMLMMGEKSNVNVSAKFNLDGMKAPVEHNITNVPLHRNYRTNIVGDLFTANAHLDIVIDPVFNDPDYLVFAALYEGGLITLTDDVVLHPEHPMIAVAGPQKPVVIDLNGYSISVKDGQTIYRPGEVSALISVQNGSVVTIKGDGLVDGGAEDYAAEVRNGVLNIEGGEYRGAYTAAYAMEGSINISGGLFSDSLNDNTFVLNLNDENGRNGKAAITVTGGTFVGFDPADNAAENPKVNFVADGYVSFDNADGTYTVATDRPSYVLNANTYEVYTAEGLAKWAYVANNIDKTVGLKLMNDITLPAKEIEEDAANETYTFTGADITVASGVPSGSNWIPVGVNEPRLKAIVDGNGYTVNGLRLNSTTKYTGFISYASAGSGDDDPTFQDSDMETVAIRNLKINDAVVYSKASHVGALVGRTLNVKCVENCHVTNSQISGQSSVGAVIGESYTRKWDTMTVVSDCTVDANTTIVGGSSTGGVVGYNYGSIILHCNNAASVSGNSSVGGIVGHSRDYHYDRSVYIIACGNTGNITATGSAAGGITGANFRDNNHTGSEAGVIACWSAADAVSGSSAKGLLVGSNTYTDMVYGSWAFTTSTLDNLVGSRKYTACYAYGSAADITQADVDAMNAAIAAYNSTRAGKQSYCPYTWSWTSGSLPVLVK